MAESNIEDEVERLVQVDQSLAAIAEHLKPLLQDGDAGFEHISQITNSLDNAKLSAALAYSLNTLFFMYVRCTGVSPLNHPIKDELVSQCVSY